MSIYTAQTKSGHRQPLTLSRETAAWRPKNSLAEKGLYNDYQVISDRLWYEYGRGVYIRNLNGKILKLPTVLHRDLQLSFHQSSRGKQCRF